MPFAGEFFLKNLLNARRAENDNNSTWSEMANVVSEHKKEEFNQAGRQRWRGKNTEWELETENQSRTADRNIVSKSHQVPDLELKNKLFWPLSHFGHG